MFRHGINNDNIGPIAKASFEETPEMFLKAARHAELDSMRGVSANVMCGQQGYFGTSAFQILADINAVMEQQPTDEEEQDIDDYDSIEEILLQDEWVEFRNNLRKGKGFAICHHVCKKRDTPQHKRMTILSKDKTGKHIKET